MASVDPITLAKRLKSLGISIPAGQLPELIPTILQSFGRHHAGHYQIPPVLSEAIAKLLEGRSAQTLLDPWAGLGTMLAIAQQATSSSKCLAFNPDASEVELAKVLFPQAEWQIGQPLSLLNKLSDSINAIVSCLPLGAKTSESLELAGTAGNPIKLRDELGNLILAAATARLSEDGMGLFVVPPSFFFSKRSVLSKFPELGFNVEATFALPSGSLAPYTSIDTYLLVVNKVANQKMFVAQLSNDRKANSQILTNFRNREEGGAVELGRYIDALEFRSIDSLRAGEYFESAKKEIGFPAAELEDLATEITLGRFGKDFNFPTAANAIYIPMIGQSDVVDSIEELYLKAQNYAQVVVDPSRSQASFITQFLNSELGKKGTRMGKIRNRYSEVEQTGLEEASSFHPRFSYSTQDA